MRAADPRRPRGVPEARRLEGRVGEHDGPATLREVFHGKREDVTMWYDVAWVRVVVALCAVVGFAVLVSFVAGLLAQAMRAAFRIGRGDE